MNQMQLELFGTFASVIIAASLMMKNLKRLRLINLLGSVCFSLYGLGIASIPVFVVNAFIVGIDLWYLVKARRARSDFSLLHIGSKGTEYLDSFLSYYKSDIAKYAPEFERESARGAEAIFVLRDMVPASLVLYRRRDENSIDILLDYAAPAFRDYQNAEYFFTAAARDITGAGAPAASAGAAGESRFYEYSSTKAHVNYLKRLGFEKSGAEARGRGVEYVKTVQF